MINEFYKNAISYVETEGEITINFKKTIVIDYLAITLAEILANKKETVLVSDK